MNNASTNQAQIMDEQARSVFWYQMQEQHAQEENEQIEMARRMPQPRVVARPQPF